MENNSITPDFKIIIEGILSKEIKDKSISPSIVIIHEAILYYLDRLTQENQTIGLIGIEELQKLQELQSKYNFTLEYKGRKPNSRELAEMDENMLAMEIRDMAYDEGATLFTASENMAKLAGAKSIL
mgnify:FL=1